MTRRNRWRTPVTVPVVVVVLAACGGHGGSDAADTTVTATVAATVMPVQVQSFTETIAALGVVAPRAGHVATLAAPASTRVTAVLTSPGDHVTRGQPLIRFDASGFDAATRSADAAVSLAEQAREREQRLVTEGIAARKDLEQAEADLARARSDSVATWRVADRAILRAPIAGVVTRMTASLGSEVDPAQPLIEIADPTAVDVLLTVTPADAERLHRGDAVTLKADHGTALGTGAVADVAGAVDSASRGVPVRVTVTHADRTLRLGESLTGDVAVATHRHAITVPSLALVPVGDGYQVFVVDRGQIAHARPVVVGGRADSLVEIVGGLSPGDRVVTYGAFGVEDSVRIVPQHVGASPAVKP